MEVFGILELVLPIGWVSVEALGCHGTTGGGHGEIVVARTVKGLKEHAARQQFSFCAGTTYSRNDYGIDQLAA